MSIKKGREMAEKKHPIGAIGSLTASEERIVGDVTLYRIETFSVTTKVTYNGSATAGIRLNMYFSPDGNNYDTVPYAYYDIDLTAGGTVQESKLVDSPERGYLRIAVKNLDTVYAASGIFIWTLLEKE